MQKQSKQLTLASGLPTLAGVVPTCPIFPTLVSPA